MPRQPAPPKLEAWPAWADEILRNHLRKGKSYNDVHLHLYPLYVSCGYPHGPSRLACIGRARRQGWFQSEITMSHLAKANKLKTSSRAFETRFTPRAQLHTPCEELPEVEANQTLLIDLDEKKCHFPLMETKKGWIYCGKDARVNSPYCPACHSKMYMTVVGATSHKPIRNTK